jgi:ATP-dependent helicase HrpA
VIALSSYEMNITEEIKRINSMLPGAMLRDQALISRQLNNLQKKKGKKGHKPGTAGRLASLRKKAAASIRERENRSHNLPSITYPEELPIIAKRDNIIEAISQNQVVIVSGETGSGKSTQIPKMCLDAGRGISGKIGCTQPRRIAASTISRRIAEELGEQLGKSVGYKIRFRDRTPRTAYIKILTDGMLLAETHGDRDLREYDTLIIDEAHERSVNIDFILGFLRLLLPRRPELKLIITSATLDTGKFSAAFGDAPVVEVSGRLFPVQVDYMPLDPELEDKGDITYVDMAVKAVDSLCHPKRSGDVLIFMPTEQDVLETCERLKGRDYQETTILPLFARLPSSSQGRVYSVTGKKIVVATNVAETSLTIPGIKYVIDSGLARISRYLPSTRTKTLPIAPISKSSADQRKGRCGRVRKGICIRLYSEEDYADRPAFTPPEILRSNLADVILRMVYLKLGDPDLFPFIDPPKPRSIKDGFDVLEELGAIEKTYGRIKLTDKGRLMARIPLDPRISRIMIQAHHEGCVEEVAVIASALSIQDPRERPPEKASSADQIHAPFKDPDSDFLTLLNIWKRFHKEWEELKTQNKMRKFCKVHFLSFSRMREWVYTCRQIMSILKEQDISSSPAQNATPHERYAGIHRSLLSGFLSNIALKKEKNIYLSSRGREAMIFPGSTLFNRNAPWIVAAEMVKTSRLFARNAAKIEPAWLESLGGSLCRSSYEEPHWEKDRGKVMAFENVALYGLPIVSRRLVSYGPINPLEAHHIFVHSALINREIMPKFEFLKHNTRLIKRFEAMEEKLRRRGILADQDILAQFYSKRLKGINNVEGLSRLIKERQGDDFLRMKEKDLVLERPDEADLAVFPDELRIGKARLKATYRFLPGKEEDGVTVKVPSALAPQIPPASLEWGVPGMVKEKVTALMKGLPKRYRKRLIPVSDTVNTIMQEMKWSDQPIINTLSRFIYERFAVDIPASVWHEVEVPPHLRTRLSITDHQGREIQSGRDIPFLLQGQDIPSPDLGQWQKLRDEWERQGLIDWDFDNLPEELSTDDGLSAYPGLLPQGDTVDIRLFPASDRAVASQKKGVAVLLRRRLTKDIRWMKRHWSLPVEAENSAFYFGGKSAVEKCMFNALERLLFHKNIRTREEFETYLHTLSRDMMENLKEIRSHTIAVLDAYHRTRCSVLAIEKANKSNKAVLELCACIKGDMERLVPPDFPEHYLPERLAEIPRYLRAMGIRAERGANDPVKDSNKALQVEAFVKALHEMSAALPLYASNQKRQGIEEFRWMIEEFKVSVFAQELGTAFPVSAKRLNRFKQELDRTV